MSTFDPALPATVHDQLNDVAIEWDTAWADHYRQHAIPEGDVIGWDGRLLDGWR